MIFRMYFFKKKKVHLTVSFTKRLYISTCISKFSWYL